MGRWITFDHESTTAIAAATTFTPELHDAKPGSNQDALGVALASNRDAVLLMPAADSERVIVAHIRHVAAPKPNPAPQLTSRSENEATPQPERTPVYEAGGFLGLRDDRVYDDEPAPSKKWWQRLLD